MQLYSSEIIITAFFSSVNKKETIHMISAMIEENSDMSEEMNKQEENSGQARIESDDLFEEQVFRVSKD